MKKIEAQSGEIVRTLSLDRLLLVFIKESIDSEGQKNVKYTWFESHLNKICLILYVYNMLLFYARRMFQSPDKST